MPEFEWDPQKAEANRRKHGISFETATRAWSDPLRLERMDTFETREERWHMLGKVSDVVLLFVVHTYPAATSDVVRIVSARKASPAERRMYDDGDFQGAEGGAGTTRGHARHPD